MDRFLRNVGPFLVAVLSTPVLVAHGQVTVPSDGSDGAFVFTPDAGDANVMTIDLGLAPKLHARLEGRRLRIDVEHSSHEQIVDLVVGRIARLVGQPTAQRAIRQTGADSDAVFRQVDPRGQDLGEGHSAPIAERRGDAADRPRHADRVAAGRADRE